jgi:hypothetical protein
MPSLVRRAIVLAAVTPLIVLLVGAAHASASPQATQTFPFSFPVTNPCNGETGTLSGTQTVSTVFQDTPNHHLSLFKARTDETYTPDNPASLSASGHGIVNESFVDNHPGGPPFSGTTVHTEVTMDVFHAPGATVVIHNTSHFTIVDGGTLVVTFDRPVLVCRGQ